MLIIGTDEVWAGKIIDLNYDHSDKLSRTCEKKVKCDLCEKDLELKNVLEKWRETLSRILWRSKNEIVIYVLKASKQENTSDSMEMNDIIEECSLGGNYTLIIKKRFHEQASFMIIL